MAKPAQYTIRGIPPEVDQALRRRARQRKVSVNRLVVEELTAAVAPSRKYADFTDLAGIWEPDPEFDKVMEEQRQIEWKKWR